MAIPIPNCLTETQVDFLVNMFRIHYGFNRVRAQITEDNARWIKLKLTKSQYEAKMYKKLYKTVLEYFNSCEVEQ